jgi:hypothetical protein
LRASIVHDSSVRRIDPITPDILRAPEKHEFARGNFPTAHESSDNIANGTPGVRVQTVNGNRVGEKSRPRAVSCANNKPKSVSANLPTQGAFFEN